MDRSSFVTDFIREVLGGACWGEKSIFRKQDATWRLLSGCGVGAPNTSHSMRGLGFLIVRSSSF